MIKLLNSKIKNFDVVLLAAKKNSKVVWFFYKIRNFLSLHFKKIILLIINNGKRCIS